MIPERTLQTIKEYIEHGYEPGHFVRAILENDLKMAFASADAHNTHAMKSIVMYCYNMIPERCWGSREIVDNWIINKQKEKSVNE